MISPQQRRWLHGFAERIHKNIVMIVTQRNSNRPLVVKSEDAGDRTNVAAMLEYHASAFS